jgi:hypothetical protein
MVDDVSGIALPGMPRYTGCLTAEHRCAPTILRLAWYADQVSVRSLQVHTVMGGAVESAITARMEERLKVKVLGE